MNHHKLKTSEKHGLSKTPTHQCWLDMRNRCFNSKNAWYHRYGARGITVVARWNKYTNFLKDMGLKPPGKTLDRINGDGNYGPKNCRWATAAEQSNNLKSTFWLFVDGHWLTRADASIKYNIGKMTLLSRIRKGWSDEECCKRPVNIAHRNKYAKIKRP